MHQEMLSKDQITRRVDLKDYSRYSMYGMIINLIVYLDVLNLIELY